MQIHLVCFKNTLGNLVVARPWRDDIPDAEDRQSLTFFQLHNDPNQRHGNEPYIKDVVAARPSDLCNQSEFTILSEVDDRLNRVTGWMLRCIWSLWRFCTVEETRTL